MKFCESPDLLASDSTLRQDSKFLKEEEYERAEVEKGRLEERQREDKKLRKKK